MAGEAQAINGIVVDRDLKALARQMSELQALVRMSPEADTGHRNHPTITDAARTMGLDGERKRKAARLIGQVAEDSRRAMGVAKTAREDGFEPGQVKEIIRRGMALGDRVRRGEDIGVDLEKAEELAEAISEAVEADEVIEKAKGGFGATAFTRGGKKSGGGSGGGGATGGSGRRGLPVGTIRTHGGVKVQKQADGSWKPVSSGRRGKKDEDPKKKRGVAQPEEGGDTKSSEADGHSQRVSRSEIQQRHSALVERAKAAGVRVNGRLSPKHTHEHLDRLQMRIEEHERARKQYRGSDGVRGGHERGKTEAEKDAERREGSVGGSGREAPGSSRTKPDASWDPTEGLRSGPITDPHEVAAVKAYTSRMGSELQQLRDELPDKNERAMADILTEDAKDVAAQPSGGAIEWLKRRVLGFLLVAGGGFLGGMVGGVLGALVTKNPRLAMMARAKGAQWGARAGTKVAEAVGAEPNPGGLGAYAAGMGGRAGGAAADSVNSRRRVKKSLVIDATTGAVLIRKSQTDPEPELDPEPEPDVIEAEEPEPVTKAIGLRAPHPKNEHGHRDGLAPGMVLQTRQGREVLVKSQGRFLYEGKLYDGNQALMDAIYRRTGHGVTVRRYFKLGGHRELRDPTADLRHLLKSQGIAVQRLGSGEIALTGDLVKAGLPLEGPRAKLDVEDATELLDLIEKGRAMDVGTIRPRQMKRGGKTIMGYAVKVQASPSRWRAYPTHAAALAAAEEARGGGKGTRGTGRPPRPRKKRKEPTGKQRELSDRVYAVIPDLDSVGGIREPLEALVGGTATTAQLTTLAGALESHIENLASEEGAITDSEISQGMQVVRDLRTLAGAPERPSKKKKPEVPRRSSTPLEVYRRTMRRGDVTLEEVDNAIEQLQAKRDRWVEARLANDKSRGKRVTEDRRREWKHEWALRNTNGPGQPSDFIMLDYLQANRSRLIPTDPPKKTPPARPRRKVTRGFVQNAVGGMVKETGLKRAYLLREAARDLMMEHSYELPPKFTTRVFFDHYDEKGYSMNELYDALKAVVARER